MKKHYSTASLAIIALHSDIITESVYMQFDLNGSHATMDDEILAPQRQRFHHN